MKPRLSAGNPNIKLISLLHPAHPIFLPFCSLSGWKDTDRVQTVEHNGILIGVRFRGLAGKRFGMRPMVYSPRMQRDHARLYVVFAEKVAVMIENEFII